MLRYFATLLVLLGHVAVWSTPCPVDHGAQASREASNSHSLHGEFASHHDAPETSPSDAERGLKLVRPCPCGCAQRPQVAGVALAPGLALLPAAPLFAFHAASGPPPVTHPPTALDSHDAPPDPVPLFSLS